jgi:hypothetical protein
MKATTRNREQRRMSRIALTSNDSYIPRLPITVIIDRFGPDRLDDDTLRAALKAWRDGIATPRRTRAMSVVATQHVVVEIHNTSEAEVESLGADWEDAEAIARDAEMYRLAAAYLRQQGFSARAVDCVNWEKQWHAAAMVLSAKHGPPAAVAISAAADPACKSTESGRIAV